MSLPEEKTKTKTKKTDQVVLDVVDTDVLEGLENVEVVFLDGLGDEGVVAEGGGPELGNTLDHSLLGLGLFALASLASLASLSTLGLLFLGLLEGQEKKHEMK